MIRTPVVFSALLLLLSACPGETGIRPDPEGENPNDTGDGDGGVNALGEACNGKDDNGNGEIDEGWPDSDQDGLPDCLERDCDVDMPDEAQVGIDEACVRDPWFPPAEPWDVAVEWHVETSGQGVVVAPTVGNLTDDNGDGFVDDRDVPEIAFTTLQSNELMVLDGATGALLWKKANVQGTAGVIIADIDNDGDNEVVAMALKNLSFWVTAFEADGTLLWDEKAPDDMTIYAMATVADLDGNGTAEVIFDKLVLDGATGSTISVLDVYQPPRTALRTPVVGDVDQDGEKEILIGPDRFTMDGTREFRNNRALWRSVHNAIANVDDDPEGEIIMGYGTVLQVIDPDGTELFEVELPGDNGGPPCVADFDGDGVVEIGIGVGENVAMYELDGTEVWTYPSVDITIAHAGCSGYDFDGDGAYELLHADQHALYIFDGATGNVLYRDIRHTSTTHFEYPVIADVDNDGNAEIVLPSNINEDRAGWAGITVFGHAGSGWARSGPTWAIHDFAVTNIRGDGSVPPNPTPPWLAHNVFRARPTVDTEALANLQVGIVDACVGTCEGGPIKISYVVANVGGAPVRPGTRVTLYRMERFEKVPLQSRLIPRIPPGTSLPADVFVLQPWEMGDGLLIEVDDDGSGRGWVEECDETDNWVAFEDQLCAP